MSDVLSNMKTSDSHMIQLEMSIIKLSHLRVDDDQISDKAYSDTKNSLTSSSIMSMENNKRVIDLLIARTCENLPAVEKIRLLNPQNKFLLQNKLKSFNHLRVLLAFLLDIGETIVYHRLSSLLKIVSLDLENQLLVIDCKKSSDTIKQLKSDLERLTEVKWEVIAQTTTDAITYIAFLNQLDSQHEEALLQTDIVKYILGKFDGLKVEKIKLNHKMN